MTLTAVGYSFGLFWKVVSWFLQTVKHLVNLINLKEFEDTELFIFLSQILVCEHKPADDL